MTKCWQHDMTKRPKFGDLVSILHEVSKIFYPISYNKIYYINLCFKLV